MGAIALAGGASRGYINYSVYEIDFSTCPDFVRFMARSIMKAAF
ncbi:hypothetical protein I603_0102 [Erythrobacter dokdonensis DSW-74]|uniref:Uncharacterized protein n=1 Tax=Erythrobacter dokdonensis DSW-74 TaxID=1300349 RepID=A0A1A7BJS1_9SPHN|nr:hypothetical protein I603_0102 [Erythrobacter dokdonensis DSW-74]